MRFIYSTKKYLADTEFQRYSFDQKSRKIGPRRKYIFHSGVQSVQSNRGRARYTLIHSLLLINLN